MTAKKRAEKNSVQGQIATMQELAAPFPKPSAELSAAEQEHFVRIINSRERVTWSETDLVIATSTARSMALLDSYQAELVGAPATVLTEQGNRKINPLINATNTLQRAVFAAVSLMGLSASKRGIAAPQQARRNISESITRDAIGRAKEHAGADLI